MELEYAILCTRRVSLADLESMYIGKDEILVEISDLCL